MEYLNPKWKHKPLRDKPQIIKTSLTVYAKSVSSYNADRNIQSTLSHSDNL